MSSAHATSCTPRRSSQDGISTIRCCVATNSSGFVIHHLDKIGVGVAYGEVALVPVNVLLPKRRTARVRELAKEWRKMHTGAPARMSTEEMAGMIAPSAVLTDDYIIFTMCAAIIAAVGEWVRELAAGAGWFRCAAEAWDLAGVQPAAVGSARC